MSALQTWLVHNEWLGIAGWRWLLALGIATLGPLVSMAVLKLLARNLSRHAFGGIRAVGTAAACTRWWLTTLAFVLIGMQGLLSTRAGHSLAWLADAVIAIQCGLWGNSLLRSWSTNTLQRAEKGAYNPVVLAMLGWLARTMLWATLLLISLSVAGVNISAFVASLGVGGVAVALALQNILSDLFASIAIGLDKPFELDQLVSFDDVTGTIVHVGVKTTRVRASTGEEVVIGNARLLSQTVRNYARMQQRRAVLNLGITYDTPAEVVADIPNMLQQIIEATPAACFARAHFKSFGDSALLFEAVYYVDSPDYAVYMDVQQAINLAVLRRFAEQRISFAFPTQSLQLSGALQMQIPGGA